MGFRRFQLAVLLQVILIGITPILFVWAVNRQYMVAIPSALGALWLAQLAYLFHFINRITRDIKHFLWAFKYKDPTLLPKKRTSDPAFDELYSLFSQITQAFSEVRIDKEQTVSLYKLALEQTSVAIIAYNQNGNIEICNQAFSVLFGVSVSKNIAELSKKAPALLSHIAAENLNRESSFTVNVNGEQKSIATRTTSFRYNGNTIRLVALQDIRNEISVGQIEAWQKLIRILRHEILNSVSPITLLASGLITQMESKENLSQSDITETIEGLSIIKKRSKGLTEFVDRYRSISSMPKPSFATINLNAVAERVTLLLTPQCKALGIALNLKHGAHLEVTADEKLIEQALINIIKNAIEASQEESNASIEVELLQEYGRASILVSDKGKGIPPQVEPNLFTPFFTTKPTGSGIGLNLTLQIMQLHGGTVTLKPNNNRGTIAALRF